MPAMAAKKIVAILLAMAPSAKAQVCQCVPTTVTETSTSATATTTSECSATAMDDVDYGLAAISSSEYCSTSTTTETSTTAPTSAPTSQPTPAPTDPTYAPTAAPTVPTNAPTEAPTGVPTSTSTMTTTTMTTMSCTCTTTTVPPTAAPPTNAPTAAPPPTNAPTAAPTQAPTSAPTAAPTADTSTATSITATTTTATSFDVKVCAAIVPFEDLNNYSHEVTGTLYFGSSQLNSVIDANEAKATGYKVGVADKCKQMLDGWSKEVAKTESSKGCCNPWEYQLSLDDELLPDDAYYFVIMVKTNSGTYTSNGVTVAIDDVDNLGEHDHDSGDKKGNVAGLAHSTSVAYTALAAAAAAGFFQ